MSPPRCSSQELPLESVGPCPTYSCATARGVPHIPGRAISREAIPQTSWLHGRALMNDEGALRLFRDYQIPPGQLLQEMATRPEVSTVVPVYYNAETLEELYDRHAKVMAQTGVIS